MFNSFEIFVLIIFIGLILLFLYANYKCNKDEVANRPETKNRLEENGILIGNVKSLVSFNDNDGCLVYTNDNKLMRVKHGVKKENSTIDVFEIDIDKILDIKVDLHIQEKTCMRVIALVPTFDNSKKINKINMVITTEDEIISLDVSDGHTLFNTNKIFIENKKLDWSNKINELNRLKLLIEKNINNTNQ